MLESRFMSSIFLVNFKQVFQKLLLPTKSTLFHAESKQNSNTDFIGSAMFAQW